jgi:F420-dependent oxidoreductase-like protein
MRNNDKLLAETSTSSHQSKRDSIGLVVSGRDAAATVANIIAAEAAGVRQIWTTQPPSMADTLTLFAAAARQTGSIRLGTAIVPTYPRHPLALALQVLALDDLAPGRLRLGIGTSHAGAIEGVYGIPMTPPLEHLREYVSVLRALLWEGRVDHQGRFYKIKAQLPHPTRTPILISALGEGAFRLAGEVTDGAISWTAPVPYLLEKSKPSLQAGAAKGERAAPPLLAHISVALSQDRRAVLAAGRRQLGFFGQVSFYARMFADAGFPVAPDGTISDELIDNLVISGDETTIADRLADLLASGLDELLVMSISVVDAEREQAQLARIVGQL